AEPVIKRQPAVHLPRIAEVEFVVAPTHVDVHVRGAFAKVMYVSGTHRVGDGHARLAARRASWLNIAVPCARIETFSAAAAVEFVLPVEAQECSKLESVRSLYPGQVVADAIQVLFIAQGGKQLWGTTTLPCVARFNAGHSERVGLNGGGVSGREWGMDLGR